MREPAVHIHAEAGEGVRRIDHVVRGMPGHGEVVAADPKNGFCVRLADGVVRLTLVQLEGKKRMQDLEFVKGVRDLAGRVLGS